LTIRLVDSGWAKELTDALRADASELKIICPFIKASALDRLLCKHPKAIQVITRFNLGDFAEGVSDVEVLRRPLAAGAKVRGVCKLHAKLYRPAPEEREPLASAQMLVISAFASSVTSTTRATALTRNRLVLAMASEIVAPHVADGSPPAALLEDSARVGRHSIG